jgi:hypothetical protein
VLYNVNLGWCVFRLQRGIGAGAPRGQRSADEHIQPSGGTGSLRRPVLREDDDPSKLDEILVPSLRLQCATGGVDTTKAKKVEQQKQHTHLQSLGFSFAKVRLSLAGGEVLDLLPYQTAFALGYRTCRGEFWLYVRST